ncbi:hypothetical protein HDU87_002330 [Geranomyces variabilis]|uniref:LrgB-like protein n=1 Tax=Geranomyces variabilis TaxID=109894 RepID=A0AAD5XRG4_9FUNG|nr:hypothetical protein HDU87_002330 [Geranomyces variabilis]
MLVYVWSVDRMVKSAVPASVLSMLILFFVLVLVASVPGAAKPLEALVAWCDSGVEWLLKWMTLMFAPALIIIPAQRVLDGQEIGRIIGVFAIGFCVFFTAALWMARGLQHLLAKFRRDRLIPANTAAVTDPAINRRSDERVSDAAGAGSASTSEGTRSSSVNSECVVEEDDAPPARPPGRIPVHASAILIYAVLLVPSLVIAFVLDVLQPAHLCITILTFYVGLALPRRAKMLLHPLLTCGLLTVLAIWAIAAIQRQTLHQALNSYYRSIKSSKIFTSIASRRPIPEPGAGDIIYSLLDAAVAALAVRMYKQRHMLREQAATVLTSVVVLSLASLFFHVAISRAFGMSHSDALAMGPRFVTTPLALQIFNSVLTEANSTLGVVMVLVSGMLGDVVGLKLARFVGLGNEDPKSSGFAIGVTSHAVGTAGLLQRDPAAAAVSSLTFVVFGTFSVIWTTIPPVADALRSLAGAST